MTEAQLSLLSDARISADARILGLYIATRAEGEGVEIERDDFRRLLSGAGKERVYHALGELELWKYIERKRGGRGHSDSFRFTGGKIPPLSDSGWENQPVKIDSGRESLSLSMDSGREIPPLTRPSPTTTDTPPSPSPTTAREDDPDLLKLRTLIEPHGDALDQLNRSAAHQPSWPSHVWSMYRPPSGEPSDGGGTEWVAVFAGKDQETATRALVNALRDYAGKGKPFDGRYFRRFVRSALSEIESAAPAAIAAESGQSVQNGRQGAKLNGASTPGETSPESLRDRALDRFR